MSESQEAAALMKKHKSWVMADEAAFVTAMSHHAESKQRKYWTKVRVMLFRYKPRAKQGGT